MTKSLTCSCFALETSLYDAAAVLLAFILSGVTLDAFTDHNLCFVARSRSTLSLSRWPEENAGFWMAAAPTTWRRWRIVLVNSLSCWRTKTQSLQGYDTKRHYWLMAKKRQSYRRPCTHTHAQTEKYTQDNTANVGLSLQHVYCMLSVAAVSFYKLEWCSQARVSRCNLTGKSHH